jgi:hypothetical protein
MMRAVRNLLLAVAVVATFFTTFTGAAAANGGAPSPAQAWIDKAVKEQLARKPGGVVSGNTVYYAKEDVLLTYTPPASLAAGATSNAAAMAPATADDYAGCPTSYVCLYTGAYLDYGTLALRTGSLWCPREQGTNGHLHLSDYGLQGNVRSADSENSFWTQGIWDSWGFFGSQWTMGPNGVVTNVSPDNIWMVDVCRYKDFMY